MIPFLDLKAQYAAHQARNRRRRPERARLRAVRPRRGGRGVRAGVRRLLRRQARHRGQYRHQRAASGAAGGRRRPGRRGHHRSLHLRRDRLGDLLHRRAAGLRRHRTRRRFTMDPAQARSGDHAAHQGDPAGPSLRPDGRHGRRSWRSPNATALPVIEDACQAHGAEYNGQARGQHRRSRAASASIPARTSAPAAKAASSSPTTTSQAQDDADAARLGPGEALPPRAEGLQLPHGRHPGRDPARQAAPSRRLDRGAPQRMRAHYSRAAGRLARRRDAGRGRRPAPRLSHLRRAHRATATACSAPCRPTASRPACTIRFRSICRRRIADLGYQRRRLPALRSGRATKCCRCRCIPK